MTDKAYMSDRIWCALPHILPQACQKRADDGAGLSAARDGRADLAIGGRIDGREGHMIRRAAQYQLAENAAAHARPS